MKKTATVRKRVTGWIIALGFVAIWWALLQGISAWVFDVTLYWSAVPRDLIANLLLGAIIYTMSRNLVWFLTSIAVLMAALQLVNAAKVVVLGGPMMPDDVLAVSNMFMLFEGWQLVGVAVIVVLPFALLAVAIAWRSAATWVMVAVLATAGWGLVQAPAAISQTMDGWFGNTVWNQRSNFSGRGLLIHLVQESARYLARGANPPTRTEVKAALSELHQAIPNPNPNSNPNPIQNPNAEPVAVPSGVPGRNVHMIVLESFWDPMALTSAGLSADPIDPAFRALWAQTGNSKALSPVYGGYTANAEFEVLCGFPVTEDAVFFEGWLRRDVPCLPRQLKGIGYQSVASHPNIAAFWNRVNAYHRIGFDLYWSKRDFEFDDMNRNFLGDASLYRQVLQKIKPMLHSGTPIFNYVLTIFGHLDYPLNEARPPVIQTNDDSKLVLDYANTMYYKSRELMVFLAELRAQDPDALIVLFGDHLPFLGQNFDGYTASGLLAGKREDFQDWMFETLVTTPLVVIDGERGPLKLGEVPLYQLPGIILDLLGDERPSLLRLAATAPGAPLRPLPGMHFLAQQGQPHERQPREVQPREGQTLVCRKGEDMPVGCGPSSRWLQAIITLTQDLFGGNQYTLSLEPSLLSDANATESDISD